MAFTSKGRVSGLNWFEPVRTVSGRSWLVFQFLNSFFEIERIRKGTCFGTSVILENNTNDKN